MPAVREREQAEDGQAGASRQQTQRREFVNDRPGEKRSTIMMAEV